MTLWERIKRLMIEHILRQEDQKFLDFINKPLVFDKFKKSLEDAGVVINKPDEPLKNGHDEHEQQRHADDGCPHHDD